MSRTAVRHSATETATEPDVEDLIQSDNVDAAARRSALSSSPHEGSRHEFQSHELQTVRSELLEWYDVHRRKLPWRGDAPPYVTTTTHSSQEKEKKRKTRAGAVQASALRSFLKVSGTQNVKSDSTSEAAMAVAQVEDAQPRNVSPYETWVSEIMLQQTRVDTVVEYFLRWIDKFPTVAALAEAHEEDVNALWAGLGYYRRARMLHAGAKYVVNNHGGELPSTVDQLLLIPGIGPYTAGAIASIAFGIREPLVDGNVIRVMARMRAVGADPKNKQLIKFSWKTASELVSGCDRPGALNQALMELGATMCTVQNPRCSDCPVKSVCLAYEEKHVVTPKSKSLSASEVPTESSSACTICDFTRAMEWNESQSEVTKYPLKAKKNDSRQEVICVAVVSSPLSTSRAPERETSKATSTKASSSCSSPWQFLMSRRPDGGLLAGQWEFLHSKISDGDTIPSFSKRKTFMDRRLSDLLGQSALSRSSNLLEDRRDVGELTHVFSHVKHHMGIEHLHFKHEPKLLSTFESDEIRWMTVNEMQQLGITTGVKKILHLALNRDKGHRHRQSSTAPSQTKAQSSLTRRVSHVAGDGSRKRLKSIACFFPK
ncbi:unnamed protein product [Hyaloperonospora brassicae]|uniref:Adenine DNA glycosylase n=1 Tax=Hyaloperonospora brassicae TaxID=162125 RepID=A0AAV0TQF4_HYABA|nr:unnamed protein product [Hyaloperonospora brassicae]